MCATYLLTWNPEKFEWLDFLDDLNAFMSGARPLLTWSCGNTKKIEIGDRVFLMRLGYRQPVHGLIASGYVTTTPFEEDHWNDQYGTSTALYIEFEPDVLLNPASDGLLDPNEVTDAYNWYPQRSGVTIPAEIAFRLESLWQQHTSATNLLSGPEVVTFTEGKRVQVSGYRYERDPHAREKCLDHYGNSCVVCGFNFGDIFGELGEGFIHVHHLVPISERDEEYEIDPIHDLRPVCPNCHAMLHRESPPLSIDELRNIRKLN